MQSPADRGRRWGMAFAVGYLVFLIFPALAELTSGRPPAVIALALAAAAVFAALDLYFWALLSFRSPSANAAATIVLMCALAVGLTVHDANWVWIFIYCGVAAGAVVLPRPWTLALVGGTILLAVLTTVLIRQVSFNLLDLALIMLMSGLGMIGMRSIFERNEELRQAREEVARLAVAEERLRFARDLHDLLGHSLSVIVLKSELAGRLTAASPERAAAEVGDIERVARQALREVREAVAGYRQPSLSQELESARSTLTAAGVSAHVDLQAGQLPTPVDSTLAWALREGVTNILRHSRARRASIRVRREKDEVRLELADDGVGCDGCQGGNGLRGLGERVAAHHGSLVFGAGPEGGFRLAVRMPVREAPKAAATRP